MQWILLSQLRLAGGAEVLPELGPWGQAGTLDDARELHAHIRGALAVAGDDAVGAGGGLFEDFAQVGQQLGEQRDQPRLTAGVVLGLGAGDADAAAVPVDVAPAPRNRQFTETILHPPKAQQKHIGHQGLNRLFKSHLSVLLQCQARRRRRIIPTVPKASRPSVAGSGITVWN